MLVRTDSSPSAMDHRSTKLMSSQTCISLTTQLRRSSTICSLRDHRTHNTEYSINSMPRTPTLLTSTILGGRVPMRLITSLSATPVRRLVCLSTRTSLQVTSLTRVSTLRSDRKEASLLTVYTHMYTQKHVLMIFAVNALGAQVGFQYSIRSAEINSGRVVTCDTTANTCVTTNPGSAPGYTGP